MRYRTKLLIAACLLLTLSLSAAGLAAWGVSQSHYYLTRSRLAHEQLEGHLQLSRHTRQLFKAWTDTLLTGISHRPLGAAHLNKVIEADLAKLRELTEQEIAFVGAGESASTRDEIAQLDAIKAEFDRTLESLGEVEQLRSQGRPDDAWHTLITLLATGIDKQLNELIEKAVADEAAEVREIDASAAQLVGRLATITQIHAGVAILATILLLVLLLRRLQRPLSELLKGTSELAAGDLSHRIAIEGRDEFAELGDSFNRMAGDLQAHQKTIEDAQATLETAVAERTEELRQANATLRKIDETRRGFFADISHELRTPLTVIRGEAEIALRGKNKRVNDYKYTLERIVQQAKLTSLLVNDLLFIARQGAGGARLNLQTVELGQIVGEVCDDAKVIADGRPIEISYKRETEADTLQGDPARLRQLFMILLDNAVRYSDTKGEVTVDLSRRNGELRVSVADRGIGIPEEEIGVVFERFRRAGNAQAHNAEGLGLGLPVAKAIVEAHKGRIEMASKPGKGTVVTVTLPAQVQGESRT
jgi:two-component system, OmpR family, sensor kinase